MLNYGIIEKYKDELKVRVLVNNGDKDQAGATATKDLPKLVCSNREIDGYKEGDTVVVGYIYGDVSKPVVLCPYGKNKPKLSVRELNALFVESKAELPANTSIGKVGEDEFKNLQGLNYLLVEKIRQMEERDDRLEAKTQDRFISANNSIEGIVERVETNEENISNLQTTTSTNTENISTNATNISSQGGKISALEEIVGARTTRKSNTSAISGLGTRVGTNESDIGTLKTVHGTTKRLYTSWSELNLAKTFTVEDLFVAMPAGSKAIFTVCKTLINDIFFGNTGLDLPVWYAPDREVDRTIFYTLEGTKFDVERMTISLLGSEAGTNNNHLKWEGLYYTQKTPKWSGWNYIPRKINRVEQLGLASPCTITQVMQTLCKYDSSWRGIECEFATNGPNWGQVTGHPTTVHPNDDTYGVFRISIPLDQTIRPRLEYMEVTGTGAGNKVIGIALWIGELVRANDSISDVQWLGVPLYGSGWSFCRNSDKRKLRAGLYEVRYVNAGYDYSTTIHIFSSTMMAVSAVLHVGNNFFAYNQTDGLHLKIGGTITETTDFYYRLLTPAS